MNDLIERLTALHTSLVDARSGYREGLKDAHGKGLSQLFTELIALHGDAADAVAAQLEAMDAPVDDDGSLMGTFDRAVMKVTSLFTALDDKIIPNLVDGEREVLRHYDQAIEASSPDRAEYPVLIAQHDSLQRKVAEMLARKAGAA
jgi:uncharacterized protein (TIGR02284 family)